MVQHEDDIFGTARRPAMMAEICRNRSTNFSSQGVASDQEQVIPTVEQASDVYDLGEMLGRGSFGTVYKALHKLTGETVAVKVRPSIYLAILLVNVAFYDLNESRARLFTDRITMCLSRFNDKR